MKLIYISNHRFPTEKAHGLQIAKMLEAFIEEDVDTILWAPARKQTKSVGVGDAKSFYKLRTILKIERIRCWDFLQSFWMPRRLAFYLQTLSFSWNLRKKIRKEKDAIFFSRSLLPMVFAKKKIWFYEAHSAPKTWIGKRCQKWVLSRCSGVICISESLKKKMGRIARGVPTLLAHDGVDLKWIAKAASREKARQHLKIKGKEKLVVYTGSPFPEKGVLTLAEATKGLVGVVTIFVGGREEESGFQTLKKKAEHAWVFPYVPHEEVRYFLSAADVLVIPNSAKDVMTREESSPLKLFEYMAVGKKIVASRVKSLTHILDEKSAWFFTPDDPDDLRRKILEALKSSEKKGDVAQKKVQNYSWESRAKKILSFIEAQA